MNLLLWFLVKWLHYENCNQVKSDQQWQLTSQWNLTHNDSIDSKTDPYWQLIPDWNLTVTIDPRMKSDTHWLQSEIWHTDSTVTSDPTINKESIKHFKMKKNPTKQQVKTKSVYISAKRKVTLQWSFLINSKKIFNEQRKVIIMCLEYILFYFTYGAEISKRARTQTEERTRC